MRYDSAKHDGYILLAYDERKGIWGSELNIRINKRTIRTSGSLSPSASAHTLQLIALVSALRAITKSQARTLSKQSWDNKPRIQVFTHDKSFADALVTVCHGRASDEPKPKLRAGRNFAGTLTEQLRRYMLTTAGPEADDNSCLELRDWAVQHNDRRFMDALPAVLAPRVVTELGILP